jgi:hypothetical protein
VLRLESADLTLHLEESDPSWATLWLVERDRRVTLGSDAAATVRQRLRARLESFLALRGTLVGDDDPKRPWRHVISLFEGHHSLYTKSAEHGGVCLMVQDGDGATILTARLTLADAQRWIASLGAQQTAG